MIRLAAAAGAHAVKFQTIYPTRLVSAQDTKRVEQLKRFQLSFEEYEKLNKVAAEENVLFMTTAFDLETVARINPIVPAYKIASGDNTFYPLIDAICKTGKPILLSGGLCTIEELEKIRDYIYARWKDADVDQALEE